MLLVNKVGERGDQRKLILSVSAKKSSSYLFAMAVRCGAWLSAILFWCLLEASVFFVGLLDPKVWLFTFVMLAV